MKSERCKPGDREKIILLFPYGKRLFEEFVFPNHQLCVIDPYKIPKISLKIGLLFLKNLTAFRWPSVIFGVGYLVLLIKSLMESYLFLNLKLLFVV